MWDRCRVQHFLHNGRNVRNCSSDIPPKRRLYIPSSWKLLGTCTRLCRYTRKARPLTVSTYNRLWNWSTIVRCSWKKTNAPSIEMCHLIFQNIKWSPRECGSEVCLIEWCLSCLKETMNQYDYTGTNLLSCKTPDVKHFHSTTHFKSEVMSMLQYCRAFGNSVKESVKTLTLWSAYYFTHPDSWYPLPEGTAQFKDMPKLKPLPALEISPQNFQRLKDFASVYVRTVRQPTHWEGLVMLCVTHGTRGDINGDPCTSHESDDEVDEGTMLNLSPKKVMLLLLQMMTMTNMMMMIMMMMMRREHPVIGVMVMRRSRHLKLFFLFNQEWSRFQQTVHFNGIFIEWQNQISKGLKS